MSLLSTERPPEADIGDPSPVAVIDAERWLQVYGQSCEVSSPEVPWCSLQGLAWTAVRNGESVTAVELAGRHAAIQAVLDPVDADQRPFGQVGVE